MSRSSRPRRQSLLAFDYPALEVIIVDDGSSDATLATLLRRSTSRRTGVRSPCLLPHRAVSGMFRCAGDPNLVVVDKEDGGKADTVERRR